MGNSKSKVNKTKKPSSSPSSSFYVIRDNYLTYEDLQADLRKAGLESSQLIIGIDYTKSNTWNGEKTFHGRCLHYLSGSRLNPYQKSIEVIARTLQPFDDDQLIPVYGFGDASTRDKTVFPFYPDGHPCYGLAEILQRYNEITPQIQLSGPTSFAPLIHQAIQIVQQTGEYHILLIIADGQVTKPEETQQAIIEASHYPLSIILIGVGDGPWDRANSYDDGLSNRKFDNFQFVPFHQTMTKPRVENYDIEFARMAMMEIPEQYQTIKRLHLLDRVVTKRPLEQSYLPTSSPPPSYAVSMSVSQPVPTAPPR